MWRAAVIAAAAVLVYANALHAPFVYDDTAAIMSNEHIRSLRLPDALFSDVENPTAGRPLVNLSFALNYAAGGLDPFGYHVANLAVHIACALLIFAITSRTLGSMDRGFAAALLWAVHPLTSETIDYVTQRTESLMALFYLLTLYAAIRSAEPRSAKASRSKPTSRAMEREASAERHWTAVAILACAAGMACKESMATAPLMVLFYDRAFAFGSFREAFRRRAGLYAGLASTWMLLAALLWSGPRAHSAGFASGVSAWTYLLNQTVMIVRYLRLAAWPRDLVVNYGWPRPLTFADVWPYAIAVLALIGVTIAGALQHRRLAFVGVWFFVTLAPTSTIVPIATEVGAERRMYLPLIALVAGFVVAASWVQKRARLAPAAMMVWLAVASASLAAATIDRNRDYASSWILAQADHARWPSAVTDTVMGIELVHQKRYDEALAFFHDGADNGYPPAHYHLGGTLFTLGRYGEAARELNTFVGQRPMRNEAVSSRMMLGRIYALQRRPADAVRELQQAGSMDPSNTEVLAQLADALLASRQFDRAAAAYQQLLTEQPGLAPAALNLGIALASSGHAREAMAAFSRARDLDPHDPRPAKNMAALALNVDDARRGIEFASDAVRVAPSDAEAHDLLGRGLAAAGRLPDAEREFERALALQPDFDQARQDLQTVRKAAR